MALFTASDIIEWLHVPDDIALEIATGLNEKYAEREVRRMVGDTDYEDARDNKARGDDKWDRIAQAEALVAFSSYIGNRGGIRMSEQGGLVRDLGIVNQQQTIRQLLNQNELEQVQGRLIDQAEDVLDDFLDPANTVWGP